MTYTLHVKVDTWLKQQPVQGSTLSDSQRQFVQARTHLPLSYVETTGNHLRITLGANEQKQQHVLNHHITWYVYAPAVEIHHNGRPLALDQLMDQLPTIQAPYQLHIEAETWLKLSTAQSSTLADHQKHLIRQGSVLACSSFTAVGRYHLKVALGKDLSGQQLHINGRTTWYAYRPAVHVFQNGQRLALPTPTASGPIYTAKILLDTWLKQSTGQGSSLPEAKRQFVKAETVLPLSTFRVVGNNHVAIALGLDESGTQLQFKGLNTWYVYRPAVQVLKNGNAIDLFPPTIPEQQDRYVLDVRNDTYLKLSTAQSSSLPDSQKQFVAAGSQFPMSSYMVNGNHVKVAFGINQQGNRVHFKGRNTWHIYTPAIRVLKNGRPVDLSPRPHNRQINAAGLRLLKTFEGLELHAYLDPVGVWTIGYGTTTGVYAGQRITEAQAELLLQRDLQRFEAAVEQVVKRPITDNQFSALVSFTYNVGSGALGDSTLLRLLNQGNIQGAANQFLVWVYAGGMVLPGLARRRRAERLLFLT